MPNFDPRKDGTLLEKIAWWIKCHPILQFAFIAALCTFIVYLQVLDLEQKVEKHTVVKEVECKVSPEQWKKINRKKDELETELKRVRRELEAQK